MEREVNQELPGLPEQRGIGAPALEKGLDILQVLAAEPGGLTQRQLALRVGRSVSEIFRMLGVLERRGFIARDGRSGEYSLTLQLYRLATQHPPIRRLQHVSLPIMEALAARTGLSCHLSMASGAQFLIVAQAEAPRPMGWVVRLGAVFPLSPEYTSARVLAAFQTGGRRADLLRILAVNAGTSAAQLLPRLEQIAARGYDRAPSEVMSGLTDLSCPILDERGQAIAALALPFLAERHGPRRPDHALAALREAAAEITARIGGPSHL